MTSPTSWGDEIRCQQWRPAVNVVSTTIAKMVIAVSGSNVSAASCDWYAFQTAKVGEDLGSL
jgi:hypothetical protein